MFNEAKLRGRIIECCGTVGNFAKKLNVSAPTMTDRLKGKGWSRAEIADAAKILNITAEEIPAYFFADCVQKDGTA